MLQKDCLDSDHCTIVVHTSEEVNTERSRLYPNTYREKIRKSQRRLLYYFFGETYIHIQRLILTDAASCADQK